MKKITLTLGLLAAALPVFAQTGELVEIGGALVCSVADSTDWDDRTAFINVMLWTIDYAGTEKDNLVSCDWKDFKESSVFRLSSPTGRRAYSFDMSVKVEEGEIQVMVQNIKEYPLASVKIGVALEKFYPANKPAKREILEEAQSLIGDTIDSLVAFVRGNKPDIEDGWSNICSLHVVRGMTQDACKLVHGKPEDIQVNGKKAMWLYPDGHYLLFENGHLKSIM